MAVNITSAIGANIGANEFQGDYRINGTLSVGGSILGKPLATALNTVGAGTILAAGIAGGTTARGGAQSGTAFTDTTDTAALIIAALANPTIGQALVWIYQNNTNAQATIAGGAGVTVSGVTIVPANGWAKFLVTYTAAATVTVVAVSAGTNAALPPVQWNTTALSGATLTTGLATGASNVYLTASAASGTTLTTRTATLMFADIPNAQAGLVYSFTLTNTSAGTTTLAGGVGVTVTGTATLATNTWRAFVVTINSATTMTFQSVATGTMS